MIRALLIALLLAVQTSVALAVNPGEVLEDPALEARARAISQELRCVVCQNQTIDDSDATLARDLRRIVRERLVAGDSDEEVMAYVVARYGDFVRLRPPFRPSTYVLWFGPLVLLLVGAAVIFMTVRRGRAVTGPAPLSAEEEAQLADTLKRLPKDDPAP